MVFATGDAAPITNIRNFGSPLASSELRLACPASCISLADSGLFSRNIMLPDWSHSKAACAASLTNMMMRSFRASLPIVFKISDAGWLTGSSRVVFSVCLVAFFGCGDP